MSRDRSRRSRPYSPARRGKLTRLRPMLPVRLAGLPLARRLRPSLARLRAMLLSRTGLALLAPIVVAISVLALATLRSLEPLPATLEPDGAESARPRYVDRNGLPLNVSYADDWNLYDRLELHEIPVLLREAFVYAEDKRFYRHGGPDWRARLSALATNLRHLDSIRGASTITEQVVRMLHPRPRTVWTRWIEGFEAAGLERRFAKDEILRFYLNQVPYASERRGVRQAAELYFARDLATLSDREVLALAVLVRSPSRLDLRRDLGASAGAIERLADILLANGVLSAARHRAILAHPVELEAATLAVAAPHFLRYAATATGTERGAGAHRVPGVVRTTLDGRLQAEVQALLDTRVDTLASLGVGSGAVLVVDNASGEVLAWANAGGGRRSGPASHIDGVTTPRQPGSAMKPMLYALALERGATLADIVIDAPLAESIGDGLHRYRNYSERHYGPVTLRDALANSLNIPAVKLLHAQGGDEYLAHLSRLGIESLTAHPDFYGDGLALGNGAVSLFELVQAYVALANRGRIRPLTVLPSGSNLPALPAQPVEPVVSAETASLIADALSDPDARALEFGRNSVLNLPVQTAVKTGTSNDYHDAWIVGFDARFTVGIWMGNLDQTPMNGVTGSIGPALLLRSILAYLNTDGETAPLYLSPKLVRREVCRPQPLKPGAPCQSRQEWFDPKNAPATGAAAPDAAASSAGAATTIDTAGVANAFDTRTAATVSATPTRETVAALGPAFASIRMRQPTDGLELAWDPRVPAASQAFRFVLDGVDTNDQVTWTIDGQPHTATGDTHVWPVTRGPHEVTAEVTRNGILIATMDPIHFRVR